MSLELKSIHPPAPATSRGRRTPLSYDPRSKCIAYASNKLVVVRSVENPETATQVYGEHLKPVTTVSFSPSGFYIASGDAGGEVRVWSHGEGEVVTKGPFQATSGKLNGVAWCGESSRVLAVGDGKERFGHGFLADSGNTIAEISGHASEINAVAIRPCRPMRAVTVGEDGQTVFYTGPPFTFSKSVSKHIQAANDVCYSPDGKFFATCGQDRKIAVYDGVSGDFIRFIESEHEGMVLSIAFSSNTTVISCSTDCSVRVSDAETGKLEKVYQLPKQVENQQTGVIAADKVIVSVGLNGDLYFWGEGEKPLNVVQSHQKQVSSLLFEGKLFSGDVYGNVFADHSRIYSHNGPVASIVAGKSVGWDKQVMKLEGGSLQTSTKHEPRQAAGSNKLLAVSESFLEVVDGIEVELGKGTAVDVVDDLVAVGDGNQCRIYQLPDLKPLLSLPKHQSEVSAVRISPNKQYVAVGDGAGKIMLYLVANGELKTSRWTYHTSRVTGIAWSADSLRVVSGGLDTNVYVYSVERPGRNVKQLEAHKDGVTSVVWSESSIWTGGADGAVRKWELK